MKIQLIIGIVFLLALHTSLAATLNTGSIQHATGNDVTLTIGNRTDADYVQNTNGYNILLKSPSFSNGDVNIASAGTLNVSKSMNILDVANITSNTTTTKIINSSVIDSLTSTNISVGVQDCNTISSIFYQKNSSASSTSYYANGLYSCSNNRLTIYSLTLDTGENTLSLTYTPTGVGEGSSPGGSGSDSSNDEIDKFYNRTKICEDVNAFLIKHTQNGKTNFTSADYDGLKASVAINQGLSISNSLLLPFVEHFAQNCPDFITSTNEHVEVIIPDDITPDGSEKKDNTWLNIGIFALIILSVSVFAVFLITRTLREGMKKE